MPIIYFHSVRAFLDDLKADADIVERRLVRVAKSRQRSEYATITHCRVTAVAKVGSELYVMVQDCGALTGVRQADANVHACMGQAFDELTRTCVEIGLQVREGGVVVGRT